jgi:proline racemase
MGAVTTLVELGAVEPAQEIVVDTPSGPMTTRLTLDGDRVDSVAVRSVPAFAMALCAKLEVPAELRPALNGITRLAVDTVCVGGCFVMVDAAQAGLDLAAMSPRERAALVPAGMALIDAANQQLRVRHPLRPEVTTIDVVEFHQQTGPASGTSVVVYGESHMDRSPCGTGTTAKAVLLHRKGALPPGQTFTNAGPLGTAFAARIVEETTVGPLPAAVVEVEGSAVLTGAHEFLLDERDPFAQGFLV